jgi:hypothetical protein
VAVAGGQPVEHVGDGRDHRAAGRRGAVMRERLPERGDRRRAPVPGPSGEGRLQVGIGDGPRGQRLAEEAPGHQHLDPRDPAQHRAGGAEGQVGEPEERIDGDEALQRPQGGDPRRGARDRRLDQGPAPGGVAMPAGGGVRAMPAGGGVPVAVRRFGV